MKINISIIKYIRYFNLYNNIKLLKEIIIIELIIYKSLRIYLILILIMKVVYKIDFNKKMKKYKIILFLISCILNYIKIL